MRKKIRLQVDELKKMIDILDEFQDVGWITIVHNDSSGIGYTTDLKFEHTVNNIPATVSISITDVESW